MQKEVMQVIKMLMRDGGFFFPIKKKKRCGFVVSMINMIEKENNRKKGSAEMTNGERDERLYVQDGERGLVMQTKKTKKKMKL